MINSGRCRATSLATFAALLVPLSDAAAQSLAARVDAAPAGYVQFSFAARPGVCGNGRTYIQAAPGQFNGSFTGSVSETVRMEPCEPGPVRVLLDRADRQVIAIRTFVGPATDIASTDLGVVRADAAVSYLLDLAARGEGRVGRDAIFPATLADSANPVSGLVAIALNAALPRETRTSALSYVGRASEQFNALPPGALDALTTVARNEADNITVRKQALTVLGRLEHGAGIPHLIEFAREPGSTWLAREAMNVLAGSGDPRTRAFLRETVQRDGTNDELRAIALRALGRSYATQQDATLLRSVFPRLTSDRSRDAVIAAIADVGGADNVAWLLGLTQNDALPLGTRRQAIDHAARAGATMPQLTALYAGVGDQQLKDALVNVYARSTERVAVDALMNIARTETNVNVRRRAISALSKSDDPRVKELLRELVTR
jgi:HEAT repeat protein